VNSSHNLNSIHLLIYHKKIIKFRMFVEAGRNILNVMMEFG